MSFLSAVETFESLANCPRMKLWHYRKQHYDSKNKTLSIETEYSIMFYMTYRLFSMIDTIIMKKRWKRF